MVALLLRVDSTRELSLKLARAPDRQCNRCADLKLLDIKAEFKCTVTPDWLKQSCGSDLTRARLLNLHVINRRPGVVPKRTLCFFEVIFDVMKIAERSAVAGPRPTVIFGFAAS